MILFRISKRPYDLIWKNVLFYIFKTLYRISKQKNLSYVECMRKQLVECMRRTVCDEIFNGFVRL